MTSGKKSSIRSGEISVRQQALAAGTGACCLPSIKTIILSYWSVVIATKPVEAQAI
jgi:hypothetical protein